MEWTNEMALELLELIQMEPCIWDPSSKTHKNKNVVNDAWVKVSNSFSGACSIEELKKKKKSLFVQYRECLKKIKESTKTGSGAEEVFSPTWFAFDTIHSFLGKAYEYKTTMNTEEFKLEGSTSRLDKKDMGNSDPQMKKKRRVADDVLLAKQQMDEAFSLIKQRGQKEETSSLARECDLYGQLLAEKLKQLDDRERLTLMNDIDHLVFKCRMNAKKGHSSFSPQTKEGFLLTQSSELEEEIPATSSELFDSTWRSDLEEDVNYAVPGSSYKNFIESPPANASDRIKIIAQETVIPPRPNIIKETRHLGEDHAN